MTDNKKSLSALKKYLALTGVVCLLTFFFCGCAAMAASAEEYYSIGMAYFDLGRYSEAKKWLGRARAADRTMLASEYNLGRIAFETQNYDEAAYIFESILKKDPDNVLAIRAAAYTRIKTGDFDIAESHYSRLMALSPESSDGGYNHALVLYAMTRYADAENVLASYPYALSENSDSLLLYARCQKAQNKAEAIDSYAKWLAGNQDPKVSLEYAHILEYFQMYARALEEYRAVLAAESNEMQKGDLHFAIARLLLIADGGSGEGITELELAVSEGFGDIDAVEELRSDSRISSANRDKISNIVNGMRQ